MHFCKAGITVCCGKLGAANVENPVENVQNPCKIKAISFSNTLNYAEKWGKLAFFVDLITES